MGIGHAECVSGDGDSRIISNKEKTICISA
jgi:hypothetical protein